MAGGVTLGIDGLSDFVEIGRGGFSTVYSAYQTSLNRRVAVKVLAALDETGLRRFDRERRSMGTVDEHPNIVKPMTSGFTQPDKRPFLMMEYMAGGSLEQAIDERGPLPLREAVEPVLRIAEALGHSHQLGVFHRDVKPANILLSGTGVAKLGDFGIAAIREGTMTEVVSYSLAYAPPETFDHSSTRDPRDERSDLYSLAATLHALVTGRPPFIGSRGGSAAGHFLRIVNEPVPAVGHRGLDEFLATAMAKAQADRYPTATHFVEALQAVAEEPPATTNRTQPTPLGLSTVDAPAPAPLVANRSPVSGEEPPRRHWVVGLGVLVAILAVVLGLRLIMGTDEAPDEVGASPSTLGAETDDAEATPSTLATETDGAGSSLPAENVTAEAENPDGATSDIESYTGHTDPVTGMTVLPDGRIASTALDGSVQVWDPADVNAAPVLYEGAAIDGPRSPVSSLADGRVLVGGPDQTVQVWNPDDPSAPALVFAGQERELQAVVGLVDGRVASGSFTSFSDFTGRVYVWDPDDPGAEPFVYSGHEFEITALAELPDGRIVSASGDQTVHVWDPSDPSAEAIVYTEHPSTVVSLLALPDGRVLSGGLDRTVRIWNPDAIGDGQQVFNGHLSGTDGVYSLALLPDGRVASASPGGTVQVWDPDDVEGPAVVYAGHDGGPVTAAAATVVVLSDDRLASVAGDNRIHIWDPDLVAGS